ncbi:hypothetical protein B0A79_10800 [Flavobacterium piscis]|uniref:Uncharacterized protein n=1 Tax=Flavobacterium piscis TaxID=1114874 RepID=A0ABX2XR20_9FLAO|nr:hypothetical protein FLP_02180 [Flavobacterium piscis]OXG04633.1 hypothetical protein B0A79_10800 [Flavobacterium piscis]
MIEYHAQLGGFWYWILIKLGRTKLSDEQADRNRTRNLFFLWFINIIFVLIVTVFLIYLIYS